MNQRIVRRVHQQQRHLHLENTSPCFSNKYTNRAERERETRSEGRGGEDDQSSSYVVNVMDAALLLVVLFEGAVAVEFPL